MNGAQTIYAAASGHGPAGVAVIRVSGPGAGPAIAELTGKELPPPRRAVCRRLFDPLNGTPLDDGLVLWFPGPASFTGEDVAELHIHGGRAVREAVLSALSALADCRMAAPGEFSRRAFLAGKMDLTAVEGLADLVAAETEAQRLQALRQMGGALATLYEGWRDRLSRALAHLEAAIDFAEEEIPADLAAQVREAVAKMAAEIDAHLDDDHRGERLRDGISVAIVGAPNVGKSTLLNALARRDAAIVSETAGTTRDVIEVHLDLGGYPVILADTAGIRSDTDAIEEEGVRRALARAEAADIRLVLAEASVWPEVPEDTRALITAASMVVITKTDLVTEGAEIRADNAAPGAAVISVSAVTGGGMDALIALLRERVEAEFAAVSRVAGPTRVRHREALRDCRAALGRYLNNPDLTLDLAGEELRLAMRALARITGRVDVEDLLDVIFRDFCIGK